MNEDNLLIIFTRNLVYGKVKTRLAATLGHDNAFNIYKDLITYTCSVTQDVQCKKIVYYTDYIEESDQWVGYLKANQSGHDLGERMMNAFKESFDNGCAKAVIIGTDCFEIDRHIIELAFNKLDNNDIVIGPALDGGYYLLGMKSFHPYLFDKISWGTESVFDATASTCKIRHLSYYLLPLLNDVDEEKDIKPIYLSANLLNKESNSTSE